MKRVALSAVIMMIVSLSGYAQQDALISQYMFNYLLVNPGYAGSYDYGNASLLYRSQWVKLSGQPTTYLASIDGPVFKSRKVGLGLYIANDNIGITNTTTIMGNYSYHVPIKNNLKLGLGINGGVLYQHANFSNLILTEDPASMDPVYRGGTYNGLTPQIGAGAYLHSDKFFIGLSVPQLLTYNSTRTAPINGPYEYVRSYWLSGGLALEVSPDFVIRPCLMFRYQAYAPISTDINCNVLIKKLLWLGVSLRTGDNNEGTFDNAFVALIGLQITKQLRIGYSYDFSMSPIATYGGGTHEVTLGYDFGYDVMKMKSPRYF